MQLTIKHLGLKDYQTVWQAMQNFTNQRCAETVDELWLLEHPAVFTQGQSGKAEHILNPQDIPIIQTDRGGQVTYHGQGQLVAYVLMDLKRKKMGVRALVTALESILISVLADFDIKGRAKTKAPGVYVDDAKIGSIGLRVRRSRSFHGISLNVDMDLEPFSRINPCGFARLAMTQLKDLGGPCDLSFVADEFVRHFVDELGYNAVN